MPRLLLLALLVLASSTAHAATITVNTTDTEDNTDGDCSLREAMLSAELDQAIDACTAGNGADVITFSVAGTFTLDVGFRFTTEVTLRGMSPSETILTGSVTSQLLEVQNATARFERLTIEGGGATPITDGAFLFFAGANVTLEDVVIRNVSNDGDGGAIVASGANSLTLIRTRFLGNRVTGFGSGGGLYAINSSVTIRESEFRDNVSPGQGGGVFFTNNFPLVVEKSTFSGNEAETGGGLHLNSGTGTVSVSTFANNRATRSGGGIYVGSATADLLSLTITGNVADADSDGDGDGGGIWGFSGVTLVNSAVSSNEDRGGAVAPDLSIGNVWTSGGTNFISDGRGAMSIFPAGTPNATGDFVGTEAAPLDPMLGTLGNNGGFTATRLPLMGSPLIDAGDCVGINEDQRGGARPAGADCDIGAVEAEAVISTSSTPEPTEPSLVLGAPAPNPARDAFSVDFLGTDSRHAVRVTLHDVTGRTVRVLHDGPVPTSLRLGVSVDGLAPGVYLLVAQSGAGAATQRLTVVR
ncbi:MAG: choice-of-anchor Q domain-containing protein [Bacteroidota bacterium]